MDRLSIYLNCALQLNDCVILPQFGGFVCRKEGAYIDELNGILVPATKRVTFNASLNHDDELFAQYIAKRERIPLYDAKCKVEILIKDLTTRLDREESVIITKVGTFTKEKEELIFKSAENNFLPLTAALPAIKLPMPSMHVSAIDKKTNAEAEKRESKFKHYLLRGVAAVAAIALIAGAISVSSDELDIFKTNSSTKASFEPVFPFFPTTPQVNQCTSTISPECDYLDFISDL